MQVCSESDFPSIPKVHFNILISEDDDIYLGKSVEINKPQHDKTQQNECVPSEDSDQPGHPPSQIRVFAVRMKTAWVLSYPLSAQQRLRSDWADAQADLSLRLAHSHFVGFGMTWLKCYPQVSYIHGFRHSLHISGENYGVYVFP